MPSFQNNAVLLLLLCVWLFNGCTQPEHSFKRPPASQLTKPAPNQPKPPGTQSSSGSQSTLAKPVPLSPADERKIHAKNLDTFDAAHPLEDSSSKYAMRLTKVMGNYHDAVSTLVDYKIAVLGDPIVDTFPTEHGAVRLSTKTMDLLQDKELAAIIASCIASIETPYSLNTIRNLKYAHALALAKSKNADGPEPLNEPLLAYDVEHDTKYYTAVCAQLKQWKIPSSTYIAAATKLGEGESSIAMFRNICSPGKAKK